MRKYIKLTLVLLISIIIIKPYTLEAKTLRDLYKSLEDLKTEQKKQKNEKKKTEAEYNLINKKIYEIGIEIEDGQKKIKEATDKIAELEIEITNKKEQINELFRFYQLTDGENSYLEYIFGASSFTDFIYRISIVEQITKYNDELIDDMNKLIEQNKQLKIDLAKREKELEANKEKLEPELRKLGGQISDLNEDAIDIADQIKAQQSSIDYYEEKGCEMDQDLSSCVNVPASTGFYRPLSKGSITSPFGYRYHPVTGKYKFHNGVDVGVAEGTPIYSVAAGRVAAKTNKASCGGNILYVHHEVNGKKYTATYMHLLSFNVSVGDVITENDIIGYVGGSSTGYKRGGYDNCTTGAHLHFSLATGWYLGGGYSSYSTWTANQLNPVDYIYMPSRWSTRSY